jgi:hypothetical protein
MAGELPKVPTQESNIPQWMRRLAETVNNMIDGRGNARGTFTLTASAASSTLTDRRISAASHIALEPTTSNAAVAKQTLYRSAVTTGSATFTHANNAQTDKTFTYQVYG